MLGRGLEQPVQGCNWQSQGISLGNLETRTYRRKTRLFPPGVHNNLPVGLSLFEPENEFWILNGSCGVGRSQGLCLGSQAGGGSSPQTTGRCTSCLWASPHFPPGLRNPFLRENVPEAHLHSGVHSALGTVRCSGDGSDDRAFLTSPTEAGNLKPLDRLYPKLHSH